MTEIIASETIRYSSDASASVTTASYVKYKELTMTNSYTGSWRITFDLFGDPYYTGQLGFGRIYKNGVAYGIERSNAETEGLVNYSEDFTNISITSGDLIQLYGKRNGLLSYLENFRIKFDPVATTGSAYFTSSPSVARIWVDGVDKGVNTPNTISDLSAGSHSYTLKLAGYQDTSGSFSVIVGSTTTVPLVTFPASAYFTSTPTGATIWVDDTNLGTVTPATVVGLTAGSHTYRLIEVGYTNRGNFSTTAGTTTNVSATLTAVGLNGSIWIEDQYLCYIDANNVATYIVGTNSGVVAGLAGSIWIEGTQIAYIDASNNKRLLSATAIGAVAGLSGSLWVGGSNIYHIASGIQQASDISLRYSDDVEIFVPNGWQYVKYYTLTTALRRPVTVAFEICINQDIYGGQLGTVRIKDNIYPNVNDHDYSYDVGSWKPYPAGYARIVHEIQVNLVAGNSLYLIIGASSYGLYVKNYRIYY